MAASQPAPQDLPRGIIPVYEYQGAHTDFVEAVRPARVLISRMAVRRMLALNLTAKSQFPRPTTVIVTSTVPDSNIGLATWGREFEQIKRFEPDYYIPADTSVYEEYSIKRKTEQVIDHLRGYTKISEMIDDESHTFTHDPPVTIPLIKTTNEGLLHHTFDIMQSQGDTMAAFYATQYLTGDAHWGDLVSDLKTIAESAPDWLEILVVGCLGQYVLNELPSQVVAASGLNQWRERIKPQKQTKEEMNEKFQSLGEEVHSVLGVNASVSHTSDPLFEELETT
jgi:hypothetical protein